MTTALSRPEDIPGLWDIGLIFGGLAFFWIVLYLLRYVHGASGALVPFFSLWGFMIGGCYGDCHSPASADRFLAQEHLRAVATGCAAGIIIGAGLALVLILFIAVWRASARTVHENLERSRRELELERRQKELQKAEAERLRQTQEEARQEAVIRDFDSKISQLLRRWDYKEAHLALDQVQVQQFLRGRKN